MRTARAFAVLGLVFVLAATSLAQAQSPKLDELLSGVVRIKTFINPDGRTIKNLGREREGTGIVIDDSGLVLTIGYLMVEAYAAEVKTNDGRTVPANIVGYDFESGFGLLQTASPLKVRPMALGKSGELKEKDPVLVASFGGTDMVGAVQVVARREFAGNWEYLLDEAIFTAPPHPNWSGAALINREGKLVGVGSLIVGDATGRGEGPGNMFVPIDRLSAVLADLIANGRSASPAKPWIGVTTTEVSGHLVVGQVTPEGPAEKAGIRRGDIIVGVAGAAPKNLADLYRKIWALGDAGVEVPLEVMQQGGKRRFDIKSMNRMDHLKLKTTF